MAKRIPSLAEYDRQLRAKARRRSPDFAMRRLAEAVRYWRRLSFHWRLDGGDIDAAEAWRVWVVQHGDDQARALGALLLILDAVGALDLDAQDAA